MGFLGIIVKATVGAAAGVALITALPVLGAAGAITAAGTGIATVGGAIAGGIDGAKEK